MRIRIVIYTLTCQAFANRPGECHAGPLRFVACFLQGTNTHLAPYYLDTLYIHRSTCSFLVKGILEELPRAFKAKTNLLK